METTHPIPPECLEWRRYRALYLKQRGWIQRDIAEALDVSEVALSGWLARARDGGPESLRSRPLPRPRPRRRPRVAPVAARAGSPTEALPGPEAIDPRTPLARAGGVWFPRSGLDLRPRRPRHRGGVRRPLPQGPCWPNAPGPALDAATADQAGPPAGRRGDPT